MAAPAVIDLFLAFALMCSPGPNGPGTGQCRVTPPEIISPTRTLCEEQVEELRQAYGTHPQLPEYNKQGGRLYFGCFQTTDEAGIPEASDVVKALRK